MKSDTPVIKKIKPENLHARLEKLPLGEKIEALNILKASIDADKKKLEEQLALIGK